MARLRGKMRWLILAGGLIVLLLGTAAVLLRPAAPQGAALAAARERWERRPFDSYDIRLAQDMPRGLCEQELITAGERPAEVLYNSCGQPADWTVTRLFNWIAELERSPNQCFPTEAMCACRGVASTAVVYDDALGYPREITYAWYKRPNLMHGAYWRSLFDQSFPGCAKDGQGGALVVRVTLEPRP